MKITKRQLKQIIKEERAKLVNEAPRTDGRGNARANREMIKDELSNILQMMDRMSRIELEELKDRTGHWSDDTIKKMADVVLLSRMDSAYMGG
tara:strand:+ start:2045 stop:2323 length:279 start_codon:yes stop_codon:yes gene_type:complete